MNDENSSPNVYDGKNHNGTSDNNPFNNGLDPVSSKKTSLFRKVRTTNKIKSGNINTSTHHNDISPKPKKNLKHVTRNASKAVNNNKITTLVIILFIAAVIGVSFWYLNSRPIQRVLNTNNQVIDEYKGKLPELKKSASANSSNAAARKNYAVALYVTGNYEAAKNEYEAVVAIDGKDSTAYNNLGNTYRDLGQYDKAKGVYEKSFEINPTSINPYVNLANIQLYTQNDSSGAIATYQKALKAMPNNDQISLLLGMAYEKAGKTAEAKQTFQDILTRNAEDKAAKAGLDRLNK